MKCLECKHKLQPLDNSGMWWCWLCEKTYSTKATKREIFWIRASIVTSWVAVIGYFVVKWLGSS